MIYVKTFPPGIKTMSASFMETFYISNNFYHMEAVNESKSKVWKRKNPCHWGVKTSKDNKTDQLYNQSNAACLGWIPGIGIGITFFMLAILTF